MGIGLAVWRESGTLRAAAVSVLAAVFFLVAYIALYWMSDAWVLPAPIYFEIMLWPFYTLFAAYAIRQLATFLAPPLRAKFIAAVEGLGRSWQTRWLLVALPPVAGILLAVLLATNPFTIGHTIFIGRRLVRSSTPHCMTKSELLATLPSEDM